MSTTNNTPQPIASFFMGDLRLVATNMALVTALVESPVPAHPISMPVTPADDPTPRGAFPTTRRSVVAAIGDPDSVVRRDATNALVTAYWRPVYGHLRFRWRMQPADAEDLTQEFFHRAETHGFFE